MKTPHRVALLCAALLPAVALAALPGPVLVAADAATKQVNWGYSEYGPPYDASWRPIARGADGALHLVFPREESMWYARSTDDGATWSEPLSLGQPRQTADPRMNGWPALVVGADGAVHVFAFSWGRLWSADDVEVWRKTLADGTWSEGWTCMAGTPLWSIDFRAGGPAIDAAGTIHAVMTTTHWRGAQYLAWSAPWEPTPWWQLTQLPGELGDIFSFGTQVKGDDLYAMQGQAYGHPYPPGRYLSKRVAGTWSGPALLDAEVPYAGAAILDERGDFAMYWVGEAGVLRRQVLDTATQALGPVADLLPGVAGPITAVVRDGRTRLFYLRADGDVYAATCGAAACDERRVTSDATPEAPYVQAIPAFQNHFFHPRAPVDLVLVKGAAPAYAVSYLAYDDTPPALAFGSDAVAVDEGQVATNAVVASDDVGLAAVGASVGAVADGAWRAAVADGPGDSTTVTVRATDTSGNAVERSFRLTVRNVAPAIAVTQVPAAATAAGAPVRVAGTVSDPSPSDSPVVTIAWGDGTRDEAAVSGGAWSASHAYARAGLYAVTATAADEDGAAASAASPPIAVYAATAVLSGTGTITSPPGAAPGAPAATGTATFTVGAKYAKGAAVPTGRTTFALKAANVAFSSTSYDWLVTGGGVATLSGRGTVNGVAGHAFRASAVDGAPDRLRLRIWNVATGAVVYDNEPAAPAGAGATAAIRSGDVVVQ